MTIREASCSCGALRAEAEGEPDRISVCHCNACKRRSGSAFAWTASYPAGQVTTSGASSVYERVSDEGYWARFHFCPRCGGQVYYEIERRPGMISIPAGRFADRDFPPPTIAVFSELSCAWAQVPGLKEQ